MADEITGGQAPPDGANGQAPAAPDAVVETEYIRALRAENAKWRTEAQAARAKVLDFEKSQMTETEKLQAQAQAAQAAVLTAQTELRKARAEAAIAKASGKVGVDPNLMVRLIDVEYNEQGEPVNVEAAVQAVLSQYQQLRPPTVTAATNPGRVQKLTLADIRKMTTEEINKRWDEVSAVLEGRT